MSRPVDMGASERRVWIRYMQHRYYGTPFTFPEVLSYIVLGFLVAAVLVVGVR